MNLIKLLRFALFHSMRDLWRNRSRTVFALVCVATGVAAVVALRSLAFMVGDELTTNLAEINRGDIRVYASREVPELVELSDQQRIPVFTQKVVDAIRDWAANNDLDVTFARVNGGGQLSPLVGGQEMTSRPVVILFVEPEKYPFYSTIPLDVPSGVLLSTVFTGPDALGRRPVVVSRQLGRESGLGLKVGDEVRLGGLDALFVVAGIAGAEAETVLTNPAAAFLGDYVYLPMADSPLVGEQPLPDQVFVKVPLGRDIRAEEKSLVAMLQHTFGTETDFAEDLGRATVPELEEQNAEIADVIDDLILVLGLSSLLIGGIGIVNTMLVVVSRRTLEIAVLKTLGLKGYRVTLVFLVEALLMGLIGSVIGVIIGVILSYLIRGVGEEAFSLTLEWRLYPAAMFSGAFLGVVMTGLFGFMPTLIAGQVRPAIVLRPNEAQMPAAGLLQTLITLVVMITILGVLVSAIVEGAIDYGPVYMIVGGGALVGLFAGVIVANTRLGQPIPDYYVFRLPRRYDRLDAVITGAAGTLMIGRGAPRRERGRRGLTLALRGLRQLILLYGSLAIGAALASGIMLIVSEIWKPFGIGTTKPAGAIWTALDHGDWQWVLVWALVTLLVGAAIRGWARALVGVIALSSLGITVGAGVGYVLARIMEALIADTAVWDFLAEMSTGIVLVEGALALLCTVYVGYWLLVWAVGKLPPGALMAIVSLTLLSVAIGAAATVALLGQGALALLAAAAVVGWFVMRFRLWERWLPFSQGISRSEKSGAVSDVTRSTARSASAVMLSVAVVAGSFWTLSLAGSQAWWAGAVVGLVVVIGLWYVLRRSYAVDGRLILREMAGRRGRVASTLLGLSVGIAGLAIVSLTTGATSKLLKVQLNQTAEGNLLIGDPSAQHNDEIRDILTGMEGVESFSQVTTYFGMIMQINGERVRLFQDEDGADENNHFGQESQGIAVGITARPDLDTIPDYNMEEGRNFEAGDAGQNRILLRQSFVTEHYGVNAGDRLMILFGNDPGEADDVLLQFRVIGIISRKSEQTGLEELGNFSILPPDVLPDTVKPAGAATIVMVDESSDAYMDHVLVAVSQVPGVIAFELGALTQLVENLIDQLKAIPTLVAWLALVAGTAIIANTVALATQERRRQIGVMKAVGLKGRRVLSMLMIENGLIGLIAGLIGNGVGFFITVVLVLASQNPDQLKNTIEFDTMGWLVLMSIGVAIGAATFSAWSAAAEKPMNVLRYE